jgi:hypothetical protein
MLASVLGFIIVMTTIINFAGVQGELATTVASWEPAEPPFTEKPAPTEGLSPKNSGPIKFGQTFAYEDGLKVSVTNAQRGNVSDDDIAGSPGDPKVIVTVKITNGTRKNFGTNEVQVTLTYGTYGVQGEALYGYIGFEGTIAKGGSLTAKFDYAIKGTRNLDYLLVEVTPSSWEHEPAIFEGAAN